MICPKCGNQNEPTYRFCLKCGAPLEQTEEEDQIQLEETSVDDENVKMHPSELDQPALVSNDDQSTKNQQPKQQGEEQYQFSPLASASERQIPSSAQVGYDASTSRKETEQKKYKALRFIASAMKILGIICGILTVFFVCVSYVFGNIIGSEIDELATAFGQSQEGLAAITTFVFGFIASLFPILIGGSISLTLFAIGEAIYVQIDIEENTRNLVLYLIKHSRSATLLTPDSQDPQQNIFL